MGRGTVRKTVEGVGRKRGDGGGRTIGIVQHGGGHDADDVMAITAEKGIAVGIAHRSIAAPVRFAVDLDRGAGGAAIQVDDTMADRMLPTEFEAGLMALQPLPQKHLG